MNNNSNRGNSNNNSNNNRRRGRGNRQQGGGGGGGQQLNRIDSRARGNAPQLLEKYRKQAHDAHLNGDRVQAEYYLQFADHYFRVLADARVRQEEQRTRQPGERWADSGEDGDDGNDFNNAGDFPSFDQPVFARPQRDERPQRDDRPRRDEREEQSSPAEQNRDSAESNVQQDQDDRGEQDQGDANPYEPPENPFVRDNRPRGGLRPRRDRDDRPARPPRRDRDSDDNAPVGLDPALLPPAISVSREDAATGAEAEAKPRKPRARRKPSADDAGGEALETVS
ncbi:MAG: DUF4167 domain-containing protein [Novosphingobium sp.]|uniref:DUF4167 domain-containing protein n=1 Tax=Novosphingobium sp. TaxID=1874826 RepID=UPI003C7DB0B9